MENELTKKFKRIVIRGKRGRGVPIMFTPKLQKAIAMMISIRKTVCNKNNEYIFAIPNTENSCLRASEIVRKLALASGAKNPSAITSTKLRKQVATVAQLLNFAEGDVEQLANFMGHFKDVHKTFYRLPENVFQVAKVSKFLLMMEKGDAEIYRGKNLDDINVDGLVSDESEGEYSDISCLGEPENQERPEGTEKQIQEYIYNSTKTAHEHEHSTSILVNSSKSIKQKQIAAIEKPVVLQKRLPKSEKNRNLYVFLGLRNKKRLRKNTFKNIIVKKTTKKRRL